MKTFHKGLRVQSSARRGSALKWLIPLILLCAAGYLGWVYTSTETINPNDGETVVQKRPNDLKLAGPGDPSKSRIKPVDPKRPFARLPGLDGELGDNLANLIIGVEETLVGVSDMDGAKAAVTKLEESTKSLEGMFEEMKDLETNAISGIVGHLTSKAMPNLKSAFERVKAVEGAEAVVQPALDAWQAKLESIGK